MSDDENKPKTLTEEQYAKGCDDTCHMHFSCDCEKTITVCQGGKSLYLNGHGEDWGACDQPHYIIAHEVN